MSFGDRIRDMTRAAVRGDGSGVAACEGNRAIFEGVAVCELVGGRIRRYTEVANAAPGPSCLGFAPERLAKVVARQAEELKKRPEAAAHGV